MAGEDEEAEDAALRSLKPRKTLLIGNPLRADGHFYETCLRAADDPSVRLIRISCLESPDIHLEESQRGLATSSGEVTAASAQASGSDSRPQRTIKPTAPGRTSRTRLEDGGPTAPLASLPPQ